MNEEELKKDYSLPCVVYYIISNKNFRQVYTIDDIEKPSEELFGWHVCDLMTLGRSIPEYEDWVRGYMEMALENKQKNAGYLLTLGKFSITSFDDIETFFDENCDNLAFQYFADDRLNNYFEIIK